MALFTDGAISTIQDLMEYESGILETSRIESIDLTAKLALAERELEIELGAFLAREDLGITLGQIVVTDALKTWHTFRALSLAYRDAYNLQLNDRYAGKWKEYERLGLWALGALHDAGIGVVYNPIRRAAAPDIVTAAVTGAAAATYYVSVSWVAGNAEGAPSLTTVYVAADNEAPAVTAIEPPAGATGWNVYAGYEQDALTLQNAIPLGIGASWTPPPTGLQAGSPMGNGQPPDGYPRPRRVFRRG